MESLAGYSYADPYHYSNNLVGERAMGMGGAFTALSDEVAGAYYNPAGLIDIDDDYLALSMSIYQFRSREIKSFRSDKHLKENSLNVIPAAGGTIFSLGDHRVGISIVVLEYDIAEIDFHDKSRKPHLHLSRTMKSQEYLIGPAVSYFFNKNFSLGATMYGYYRQENESTSTLTQTDDNYQHTTTHLDKKLIGIMPIIGGLVKISDMFAIGLSVRTGFRIYGKSRYNKMSTTNIKGFTPVIFEKHEDDISSQFPMVFRAGVAAHIWKGNTTSFDVSIFDPVAYRAPDCNVDLETTVNFSAGIEQLIGSLYSIRAGYYTDFSAAPDIDTTKLNPPPKIDLMGVTLGMGIDSAFTTTTVGLNGGWGGGKIFQSTKILKVKEYYIGVFFGGSFRYHTEDEVSALKRWYDIDEEEAERELEEK